MACVDHIYRFCKLISNGSKKVLQTFAGFIVFPRAFESINRKLLLYKLLEIGAFDTYHNVKEMCPLTLVTLSG